MGFLFEMCVFSYYSFRLEDNLNVLERQQKDSLDKWKVRSERAGLSLDKLEVQFSVIDDPLETTLEGVKKQEEAFKVWPRVICLLQRHGSLRVTRFSYSVSDFWRYCSCVCLFCCSCTSFLIHSLRFLCAINFKV